MTMEQQEVETGVTLYPANYDTIEMITDQGQEILQQEFTDAQLFLHSIQELEKKRLERKKKKQKTDEKEIENDENVIKAEPMDVEDEETKEEQQDVTMVDEETKEKHDHDHQEDEEEPDVIDPRIHYRPMVAELQAAVAELHQLINSIDLIRRRDFLEEMYCMRENTAPKKEDLEYLVESKSQQVKESSRILMQGVDALTTTVEKESVFFQGITALLRKWKICAPIHGNIPKPFRAGEPLAVDCSFVSAGSTFTPPTRSIADLSFAELNRTEKGLVRVKAPEEYLPRTIQIQLRSTQSGVTGSYTLPSPPLNRMTKHELEKLNNTLEDLEILDERNASVLKAVQFSVFCEEVYQTVMQEALRSTSNWTETAFSAGNYAHASKKEPRVRKQKAADDGASSVISVLEVLDDEVQLRINEKYHLSIKLIDISTFSTEKQASEAQEQTPNGVVSTTSEALEEETFLSATCRYTLLLLQQEIRFRHGRKEISRGLLYTGTDTSASISGTSGNNGQSIEVDKSDRSIGTLATVLNVVGHCLLKHEVTQYLDELSAILAAQSTIAAGSGRILDDSLSQPICDTVRGIYLSPRWKTCPHDSTISAFDLNVGKNFTTEVLITGTRIRFEDGPSSVCEVSGLAGLQEFVEKVVCKQVALALHRDVLSYGLKQATMDLDRASVRIFASGEWDGTCIGEGRVSDSTTVGSIYLKPFFTAQRTISISCMIQAIDVSSFASMTTPVKSNKASEAMHSIEWARIPGASDLGKVAWLLQQTRIVPRPFDLSTH